MYTRGSVDHKMARTAHVSYKQLETWTVSLHEAVTEYGV